MSEGVEQIVKTRFFVAPPPNCYLSGDTQRLEGIGPAGHDLGLVHQQDSDVVLTFDLRRDEGEEVGESCRWRVKIPCCRTEQWAKSPASIRKRHQKKKKVLPPVLSLLRGHCSGNRKTRLRLNRGLFVPPARTHTRAHTVSRALCFSQTSQISFNKGVTSIYRRGEHFAPLPGRRKKNYPPKLSLLC